MTIDLNVVLRVDTDEKGFATLRTGEKNSAPDSDLIASVWNEDFLGLLQNAPDLLALVDQYRNDMLYPPAADSRERRIAAIDAVLGKVRL